MPAYLIRWTDPETGDKHSLEYEGTRQEARYYGKDMSLYGDYSVTPMGDPPIDKFDGTYRWLSNFWLVPVVMDGVCYNSVEHAYQAAKTFDPRYREMIQKAPTPGRAKHFGKVMPMRPDWNEVRLAVMAGLLVQKFKPGTHLAQLLDATGDVELIEGNSWGDRFWGECRGDGSNMLGELLMKIRTLNRG